MKSLGDYQLLEDLDLEVGEHFLIGDSVYVYGGAHEDETGVWDSAMPFGREPEADEENEEDMCEECDKLEVAQKIGDHKTDLHDQSEDEIETPRPPREPKTDGLED